LAVWTQRKLFVSGGCPGLAQHPINRRPARATLPITLNNQAATKGFKNRQIYSSRGLKRAAACFMA